MKTKDRKIIHVDMDAFYASIEEREDPSLKSKPLIVAKDPRKTGGRGVVSTANYNARKYGVHSAMSAMKALELCPNAVFRFSGFDLYRSVSNQIHEIFHEYTEMTEYVALDEAYLDITDNKKHVLDPIQVARMIQNEIWDQTHLTCSVGVSYNKFLAKEASDYAKPVGITVIEQRDALEFLAKLPIEKFRGVGKKTVPKMRELNINNGEDLLAWSQMDLIKHFGKFGYVLYERARGIDERPVEYQRVRKSIGKERTFGPAIDNQSEVDAALQRIAGMVVKTMDDKKKHGKTLVLKIRYADFSTFTKRMTLDNYIKNSPEEYFALANDLLVDMPDITKGVRLLGITITNLDDLSYENIVLHLFN
ncbi:DNA polymerase IV [Lentilactobacillus sunkii]|uniref:DNA polymerase IV n=1 Tax=Lentilactobacillus sunkii DSM 19904 TaxID=1423808 RepID=A0A0R1L9L7_9LACO|nr:DNA polymerase IV [Lentilactobacillus sunkii]KRK89162.1 DNA polymerase IV [Lentilactobacillus sunkii DSM 19904]